MCVYQRVKNNKKVRNSFSRSACVSEGFKGLPWITCVPLPWDLGQKRCVPPKTVDLQGCGRQKGISIGYIFAPVVNAPNTCRETFHVLKLLDY